MIQTMRTTEFGAGHSAGAYPSPLGSQQNDRPDVLVVGGGLAGLTAAVRATELGRSAIVLEQGEEEHYPCNSRLTGGAFHCAYLNPTSEAERLSAAIERITGGWAEPELARVFAADGRRVPRWLQSQGARFFRAGYEEWKSWVLLPPGWRNHWRGRGGDVLLARLERRLKERGGQLSRGVRAVELLMAHGACQGVRAIEGGIEREFCARNVVICDGGFQADPESLRKYITLRPDTLVQRGAGTGRGDGLRMAVRAGAKFVGAGRFYGHLVCRDAVERPGLALFPFLDPLAVAGLLVDGSGQRVGTFGHDGVRLANEVAGLADPSGCWTLFDDTLWNTAGRNAIVPPNPTLLREGVPVTRGANAAELAQTLGMQPETLSRAIDQLNSDVARANAGLKPLRPPFSAIATRAGITHTMDGLAVDADGAVLDQDGLPIRGLFAAGTATGGLDGGPAAGYVAGLLKAALFGLRAAEAIARQSMHHSSQAVRSSEL